MTELNLDPKTTAVVFNDIQYGVLWAPTTPHLQDKVLANVVKVYEAARANGINIMHVNTAHLPDGSDQNHAVTDSPRPAVKREPVERADELFDEVNRQPNESMSTKRGWSAFYGSDLDLQLRRHGIKTLIMGGISTNFGVESTAREAFEYGYELIFVEDCTSGRVEGMHDWAFEHIFPRLGRVRSTEQVVAAIHATRKA